MEPLYDAEFSVTAGNLGWLHGHVYLRWSHALQAARLIATCGREGVPGELQLPLTSDRLFDAPEPSGAIEEAVKAKQALEAQLRRIAVEVLVAEEARAKADTNAKKPEPPGNPAPRS